MATVWGAKNTHLKAGSICSENLYMGIDLYDEVRGLFTDPLAESGPGQFSLE